MKAVIKTKCLPFSVKHYKACLDFGYAVKIDDRMDENLYLQILKDELLNTLMHYGHNPFDIIFSRTMTPSILIG